LKKTEFTDSFALAEELRQSLSADKPVIIGIDGSMRSGKTILSYCLGCALRINVFNIDMFVNRKQGSFADQIKYKDLEERVKDKLASGKSAIY